MNNVLNAFEGIFNDITSFDRLNFKEQEVDFYFKPVSNANSKLLTILTSLDIAYTEVGNLVTANRKSNDKSITLFSSYDQLFKSMFDNQTSGIAIMIDNSNKDYYYYDFKGRLEYTNFRLTDSISMMESYLLYAALLKLFKTSQNITEFDDTIKRRLFIVDNGKEKNIVCFNYQTFEDRIFSKVVSFDIDYITSRINSTNSNNLEWLSIFKHTIVEFLSSQDELNKTFLELFLNISYLVKITERDYEIYLSGFSFDKISKELKEERQRYFADLNQAQDKIKSQVIAVPLSIGTSIYAFFQIKADHITLYFILGMILIYIGFIWWYLTLYENDLRKLKSEVKEDSNKFQQLYQKIYNLFKSDFDFINNKVNSVLLFSYTIKAVIILDWLSLAIYVIFLFKQQPAQFSLPKYI
jgi:hypothetical protein